MSNSNHPTPPAPDLDPIPKWVPQTPIPVPLFTDTNRENSPLAEIEAIEEFPRLDQLGCQNPVARMAVEITRVERVPYEMAAIACLGAFSAACGHGIELKGFDARRSRGNLFLVVGAPPGAGKSMTWKHAFAPLYDLEACHKDAWSHDTLPDAMARKRILERKVKAAERDAELDNVGELTELIRELERTENLLIAPQLTIEDSTPEALQKHLSHAGEALFLVSSEGRTVIKNIQGRYNQGNHPEDDFFVKAWSGDRTQVHRIARESVSIESPCLALCIAIQPDKLGELFSTPALADSGFLQRILPASTSAIYQGITDSTEGIDPKLSVAYKEHLTSAIETLLIPCKSRPPQRFEIEMSEPAKNIILQASTEWTELAQGSLSDIVAFVSRWTENTLRIAVVLHVMTHSGAATVREPLGEVEARLAIEIQRWFASRQLQLLSESREHKSLEKRKRLEGILEGCVGRERSFAELKNRNGIDEDFINTVVFRYPDEFETDTKQPGQQGGRPSKVVRLKALN